MIIIAIDPGYERMGVAVLEKTTNKEVLLFSDCIKTNSQTPHEERLKTIGEEINNLIKKYKPEALAIETLFFKNNAKTAMKVSEARGVMLYVASKNALKIAEYTPLQIKVAVTGYGKSEKNQVIEMVKRLIKIPTRLGAGPIKYDDEFDAIAVGLTYFAYRRVSTV